MLTTTQLDSRNQSAVSPVKAYKSQPLLVIENADDDQNSDVAQDEEDFESLHKEENDLRGMSSREKNLCALKKYLSSESQRRKD